MNKTTSLPLENWVGYRFGLVATRLGNFVAPMYASRHNLSQPAWRCLAVIARYQPLTAKQLASLTSSDAFKIARAIDLLVKRGLIRRDADKTDRRRASLSLTADGRKIYKDIDRFMVRVERELTGGTRSRRTCNAAAKPRQAGPATGKPDSRPRLGKIPERLSG